MLEPQNPMMADIKKDGLFSQIIKRLGSLEEFMRSHDGVAHGISYPKLAVMWHDQSKQTVGVGASWVVNAGQAYNGYSASTTPANGDTWTNGFFIRAGTYTLRFIAATVNDSGKVDLYIDNVLVSSGKDLYSAVTTFNVGFSQAGVVISSDGYHSFKVVVNGKNGASTGFQTRINKFWFEPATY